MSRIVMDRRLPLGKCALALAAAALAVWAWKSLTPQAPDSADRVRLAQSAADASFWSRLPKTVASAPIKRASASAAARDLFAVPSVDDAERKPAVMPQQLTLARLHAAEAFLNDVRVSPSPRGGFVVQAVRPETPWARMGLNAGDVIYTLDTPDMAAIDDNSMVAVMRQTTLELDVYRAGTLMHLRARLDRDADAEHDVDDILS